MSRRASRIVKLQENYIKKVGVKELEISTNPLFKHTTIKWHLRDG